MVKFESPSITPLTFYAKDKILDIKHDLDGPMKSVTVTFSHYETLIGEVKFRVGALLPQF